MHPRTVADTQSNLCPSTRAPARGQRQFPVKYPIVNCCGIIITADQKTDGIYLPADDRRPFVGWSNLTKDDPQFQNGYWNNLWHFYEHGENPSPPTYLLLTSDAELAEKIAELEVKISAAQPGH